MIDVKRRYSFDAYLRSGRLVSPGGVEHKSNPNHDPANGRFTFADGGGASGERSDGPKHGAHPGKDPKPTVTAKKVRLTPAQYNEQAASLWGDMEGQPKAGLKDDKDVDREVKRVGSAVDQPGSNDVEAPEDVRTAVVSIARKTVSARLKGNQEFEKTLTFERGDDGQVIIPSLGLPGAQGGTPAGTGKSTIAIAHVHYATLIQSPTALDYTGPRAGIPSFVIGAESGQVWEIGRQKGKYVQRIVHAHGSAGKWMPYGR